MTERCPECGKFYDGYMCICGYYDSEECSECGYELESEGTVCGFCGFDDDEQCFKVKLDDSGDIILPEFYNNVIPVKILLPDRLIILGCEPQICTVIRRKAHHVKK